MKSPNYGDFFLVTQNFWPCLRQEGNVLVSSGFFHWMLRSKICKVIEFQVSSMFLRSIESSEKEVGGHIGPPPRPE